MPAAPAMQHAGSAPPSPGSVNSPPAQVDLEHQQRLVAQQQSRERERAQREEPAGGVDGSTDAAAEEATATRLAAEAMAEEMAALRLENSQLAHAASLMGKMLEFRQAVLALAQRVRIAPGLSTLTTATLLPSHEVAVAAAHHPVMAGQEQLPPQRIVEASATAQLPNSSAAPAVPCCALLPDSASTWPLRHAGGQPTQGDGLLASGPATAVQPTAGLCSAVRKTEAGRSEGCALGEGGGDSSGDWLPSGQVAAVNASPAQQHQQWQQQQQQQQVQPWQRATFNEGRIPGIPLATGGGRLQASAPPAAPLQPVLPPQPRQPEQEGLLAQRPQPQPHPQQLEDPGDGWGPRGVPLLLGGGGGGRTQVLAQTFATCGAQSACAEVHTPEGRALQALGAPPPNNPAIRRRLEAVQDVAGVQRLQRRLLGAVRNCWPAAAAAQFEPGSPARKVLEAATVEMTSYFWHLAQLKPHLLNAFLLATLPPASLDMSAQWHNLAVDCLPLLSDGEITALRDAYQRYAQRVAVAAVSVRPVNQKLQALARSSPSVNLVHVAAQHTQVGELASRMHYALEQQYLATMGLLLDMQGAVNPVVWAYWRIAAGNYTPDYPAILSAILRVHQAQKERLACPASSAGLPSVR